DWSSDVCSSDLVHGPQKHIVARLYVDYAVHGPQKHIVARLYVDYASVRPQLNIARTRDPGSAPRAYRRALDEQSVVLRLLGLWRTYLHPQPPILIRGEDTAIHVLNARRGHQLNSRVLQPQHRPVVVAQHDVTEIASAWPRHPTNDPPGALIGEQADNHAWLQPGRVRHVQRWHVMQNSATNLDSVLARVHIERQHFALAEPDAS